METPVQGIAIGTVIAILTAAGSGAVWYDNRQDAEHVQIESYADAGKEQVASESLRKSVKLELQLIETELKLLRTIEERRPLSADEQDKRASLKELRAILLEAQREQVK